MPDTSFDSQRKEESYNINHIIGEEEVSEFQARELKKKNAFSTYIFLTKISHLITHLETQNLEYI